MAIDTSSVNNKDNGIQKNNPNTNYGTGQNPPANTNVVQGDSGNLYRGIIDFTLSANPGGTITDVALLLTTTGNGGGSSTIDAHAITQTGWTETGSTWNKYDGTNTWTTAGGDYSATVISSTTPPTTNSVITIPLMGTGTTNPLTLNWGDDCNILLRYADEASNPGNRYTVFYSRDNGTASNRPVLQITYTPTSNVSTFAFIKYP